MVRNTEQFKEKAGIIHNGKYGYGLVDYQGTDIPVDIECPIHGIFQQRPKRHLNGCGCPKCKSDKAKREVCRVGINDMYFVSDLKSYKTWDTMIRRCYSKYKQVENPTYIGCSVCEEWLTFSNFKRWFDENYIEGYELDKDILVKGNKVYSPETCCFVPKRLNLLIRSMRPDKCVFQYSTYRYRVEFTVNKEKIILGNYSDKDEANKVARDFERKTMFETINEYLANGKITKDIYNAIKKRYE